MLNKQFISTTALAKILGISRVAVFKKIKKGEIKAEKVGRNFLIDKKNVTYIIGVSLTKKDKQQIDRAIKKTISEYGETLKLLGNS